MHADPQTCLALTLRLGAAGVLVQSLEVLWQWRELRDERLFGWAKGRRRGTSLLWGFPGCVWLLVARAAFAASGVIVPYESTAACAVAGGLVLAQLGYNRRFTMLAGNSETMFLVALAAAWVGTLPGASVRLQSGALLFLAAHALLAYFAAGAHKLGSRLWRSGARLRQIARFGSYELPPLAWRFVETRRGAIMVSWMLIALELTLPGAIFFPAPVFWAVLAAGFAFHTVVAVTMGLHGFWWAFAAAYPAIVFAHELVR